MVKSFAALAVFAVLGTSVIALPGFAPKVEASESYALTKGNRLPVRFPVNDCSKHIWPEFPSSCLRNSDPAVNIVAARLVTARR
jgi:hypothetical protein